MLAGRIATSLGNALVAPVMAYVPEGSIDPPSGHMRFPARSAIPDAAFEATLEGAARSLRQAGFRDIVLIGDHGGYQASLKEVAARLDREWAARRRARTSSPSTNVPPDGLRAGAARQGLQRRRDRQRTPALPTPR